MFIEVTSPKNGCVYSINVEKIESFGQAGDNVKIMASNVDGEFYQAKESYEQVKQLIKEAQNGGR